MVRVTCIANGESAVVRITDRGPFIEGGSLICRKRGGEGGLVRKGTAQVRLEVLKTSSRSKWAGAGRCRLVDFRVKILRGT